MLHDTLQSTETQPSDKQNNGLSQRRKLLLLELLHLSDTTFSIGCIRLGKEQVRKRLKINTYKSHRRLGACNCTSPI